MKKVLILGGSSFMGRDLVENLSEKENVKVWMVNRGNQYWGTNDPSKGRVSRINADRSEPLQFAEKIKHISELIARESDTPHEYIWDLVVDFSAYEVADLKSIFPDMLEKARKYVFISSDSVYEVCDLKKVAMQNPNNTLIKEDMDIRPSNEKERERLAKEDEYAEGKKQCEEYLDSLLQARETSKHKQCEIISLRLADVLGPYDDTGRYFATWAWLKILKELHIAHGLSTLQQNNLQMVVSNSPQRLNFTYSSDVVRFIESLLYMPFPTTHSRDFVEGRRMKIFNLACEEHLTLLEFIKLTALKLKERMSEDETSEQKLIDTLITTVGSNSNNDNDSEDEYGCLPSVEKRMNPLDMTKIKSYVKENNINFHLSTLSHCVDDSFEFFEYQLDHFPYESKEAIKMLPKRFIKQYKRLYPHLFTK